MGNVVVWVIWLVAAAACLRDRASRRDRRRTPSRRRSSLIGNLASLAVLYLLASGEFVAAAQVLVYAGAVMVMFLFVIAYLGGRADAPWAGGTRAFQFALGRDVARAAGRDARRARARRGRQPLRRGRHRPALRQPRRDRPAASSPTICSRSRSRRSCCSSAAVGGVVLGMRSARRRRVAPTPTEARRERPRASPGTSSSPRCSSRSAPSACCSAAAR